MDDNQYSLPVGPFSSLLSFNINLGTCSITSIRRSISFTVLFICLSLTYMFFALSELSSSPSGNNKSDRYVTSLDLALYLTVFQAREIRGCIWYCRRFHRVLRRPDRAPRIRDQSNSATHSGMAVQSSRKSLLKAIPRLISVVNHRHPSIQITRHSCNLDYSFL